MLVIDRLEVPEKFKRNAASVRALGIENTGQKLMELAMIESGRESLDGVDVLDVGCGVRFTQTIINRSIPIGSYTGIEVNSEIIEFLKQAVESADSRFRFFHLDVHNARYNRDTEQNLSQLAGLPIDGKYDQIWLFSVFTHLNLEDAEAMLRLLRMHIRPSGMLLFSAFIDADLDGFEDRSPQSPLLNAYFGLETMRKLISQTGWLTNRFSAWKDHRDEFPVVDYFVCSPNENRN